MLLVADREPLDRGSADRARRCGAPGWSANVYTLVSDSFPRQAIGSVVGIGGMASAVGGVMLAVVTGVLLQLRRAITPSTS